MEYRPRSTIEKKMNSRKINLNNNNIYFNFYSNKEINQSPKISSNKIRNITGEEKLFSLIDINDKITNSKGTKLANQYKRLSKEEFTKQFGIYTFDWSYDKTLIKNYLKNIQSSKSLFNSKNNTDKNDLPNLEKKTIVKSTSQPKDLNKNSISLTNCEKENHQNIYRSSSMMNLDNVVNEDNKNKKNFKILENDSSKKEFKCPNTTTKRNDRWLPKNYQNYEMLVKNPHLVLQKIKEDSFKRKIPFLNSKEISKKMNDTDVFFTKNKKILKNVFNQRKKDSSVYSYSDIHCIKNDIPTLSRCGETYLFKKSIKNKYTSVNESNSKWKASSNLPNLVNYSSIEYNILCPDTKSNNKTKQNIIEECTNKTNNDNNKKMFFNPTHKQKGLSEFIDITQNGSGNPGKEFEKIFKENPFCCQQHSDVCATFGDLHLNYRSTCTKPFFKERF
jgi:hypothetical protein